MLVVVVVIGMVAAFIMVVIEALVEGLGGCDCRGDVIMMVLVVILVVVKAAVTGEVVVAAMAG